MIVASGIYNFIDYLGIKFSRKVFKNSIYFSRDLKVAFVYIENVLIK